MSSFVQETLDCFCFSVLLLVFLALVLLGDFFGEDFCFAVVPFPLDKEGPDDFVDGAVPLPVPGGLLATDFGTTFFGGILFVE